MNITPILDQTPEPRREDFQDQEVFKEAQHRWRWTIGRSAQFPDPMQPAVDAIEEWGKLRPWLSDEFQTLQEESSLPDQAAGTVDMAEQGASLHQTHTTSTPTS